MFLDEISIQTSILIFIGLGFAFFLGIGYYFYRNPIDKNHSFVFILLLGTIRGLLLVALVICIFPFKIFKNPSYSDQAKFIFIVDFPDFVTHDFLMYFKKIDSTVKINYPQRIWIDFLGNEIKDFKKPVNNSRSLNKLNQTIRKLLANKRKTTFFLFSDGNLNDVNVDTEVSSKIHIIPFGVISNKEQIEFSTTQVPIISVIGEEVHFPVEVWIKNFLKNRSISIRVFIDGVLVQNQSVSFDKDHLYHSADFILVSNKLGKHKVKVEVENGLIGFLQWNVVNEKAIVYGFSDVLDPDIGVLNRVSKDKFIKLIWKFDATFKMPIRAKKFIFKGFLPNQIDKSKILNSSILFLNISKDKVLNNFGTLNRNQFIPVFGETLWDLQITEFQDKGSYARTDSIVGTWFEALFLTYESGLDSSMNNFNKIDDTIFQDSSKSTVGRNQAKLNFLSSKKNIDLIELKDLNKNDFIQHVPEIDLKRESEYIWQNIYFKFIAFFLIITEWLLRKFNELR